MTKLPLTPVASLQNETTALNTINANSAAITTAMENTLSRDGTSPNTMGDMLDMNSNQIINLPAPLTGTSPLRLQDASTLNGGGTIANVPTGGTSGQVLSKNSNANFDLAWRSSAVNSVGLALPSDFTITNSPVTSTGTLTGSWAIAPNGTGAVVRTTSPALVTPALGTPTSGVMTNVTAVPAAQLTGTSPASAMPALTGDVTSTVNTVATTIAANAVTNAKMAQAGAFTIKGNATGSTANLTDISIPALTQKVSPAPGDFIMIADSAASNALKYSTVSSISAGGAVSTIAGNTGAFTLANGISNTVNQIELTAARRTLPTVQTFLSGSGTYTTPANCLWIEVEIVGGGGGGGGSGTGGTGGSGGTGGNSSFNTFTANGGVGGGNGASTANGGVGGSASSGSMNIQGTQGTFTLAPGVSQIMVGGNGGGSAFFCGGAPGNSTTGSSAPTNTGGGGGGGGTTAGVCPGSGGGGGGSCRGYINTPSATYSYVVGAAGTAGIAGTSGNVGGAGGSGFVLVREYYN